MTTRRKPRKKKTAAQRARRPRELDFGHYTYFTVADERKVIATYDQDFSAKQARKLAAWLIKAAGYLESK